MAKFVIILTDKELEVWTKLVDKALEQSLMDDGDLEVLKGIKDELEAGLSEV